MLAAFNASQHLRGSDGKFISTGAQINVTDRSGRNPQRAQVLGVGSGGVHVRYANGRNAIIPAAQTTTRISAAPRSRARTPSVPPQRSTTSRTATPARRAPAKKKQPGALQRFGQSVADVSTLGLTRVIRGRTATAGSLVKVDGQRGVVAAVTPDGVEVTYDNGQAVFIPDSDLEARVNPAPTKPPTLTPASMKPSSSWISHTENPMVTGRMLTAAFTEAHHPRDTNGRFISVGDRVNVKGGDGRWQRGTVDDVSDDGTLVGLDRGDTVTIAPADTTSRIVVAPDAIGTLNAPEPSGQRAAPLPGNPLYKIGAPVRVPQRAPGTQKTVLVNGTVTNVTTWHPSQGEQRHIYTVRTANGETRVKEDALVPAAPAAASPPNITAPKTQADFEAAIRQASIEARSSTTRSGQSAANQKMLKLEAQANRKGITVDMLGIDEAVRTEMFGKYRPGSPHDAPRGQYGF